MIWELELSAVNYYDQAVSRMSSGQTHQTWHSIRVPDIDDGVFLLLEGGACQKSVINRSLIKYRRLDCLSSAGGEARLSTTSKNRRRVGNENGNGNGNENSLSKLRLRSCPYLAVEEAGVVLCCGCGGVRGELEYDDDELELAAAAALLLSPYPLLVGMVMEEDMVRKSVVVHVYQSSCAEAMSQKYIRCRSRRLCIVVEVGWLKVGLTQSWASDGRRSDAASSSPALEHNGLARLGTSSCSRLVSKAAFTRASSTDNTSSPQLRAITNQTLPSRIPIDHTPSKWETLS